MMAFTWMEGAIITQQLQQRRPVMRELSSQESNAVKLSNAIDKLRDAFAAAEDGAVTGHIAIEVHFARGVAKTVKKSLVENEN